MKCAGERVCVCVCRLLYAKSQMVYIFTYIYTHAQYNTRHINYTHLSWLDVAHSIIKLNGNRDGCGLMG